MQIPAGGGRVRQTPNIDAPIAAHDFGSAGPSAARPMLNVRGVADLLDIKERSVHELRTKGLLPEPIQLGPRSLRWFRDEVLQYLRANAPRGGGELPPQLGTAEVIAKRNATNARRSGAAGGARGVE